MSDNMIQLKQKLIYSELKDLVRNSVEETLNAVLLDHEAEVLVNAGKYERSRECFVKEALIEVVLTSASVRRIEDITEVLEVLWGSNVSLGTINNMNQKAYEQIEAWRARPITGTYPYVTWNG